MRNGSPNGTQHGLLKARFIPSAEQREVRELTRFRTTLTQERARPINRVQKVLEDANIKLSSVVTDIMGKSGRMILHAPLGGTRGSRAAGRPGARKLVEQARTTQLGSAGPPQRAPSALAQGTARLDSRPRIERSGDSTAKSRSACT